MPPPKTEPWKALLKSSYLPLGKPDPCSEPHFWREGGTLLPDLLSPQRSYQAGSARQIRGHAPPETSCAFTSSLPPRAAGPHCHPAIKARQQGQAGGGQPAPKRKESQQRNPPGGKQEPSPPPLQWVSLGAVPTPRKHVKGGGRIPVTLTGWRQRCQVLQCS